MGIQERLAEHYAPLYDLEALGPTRGGLTRIDAAILNAGRFAPDYDAHKRDVARMALWGSDAHNGTRQDYYGLAYGPARSLIADMSEGL